MATEEVGTSSAASNVARSPGPPRPLVRTSRRALRRLREKLRVSPWLVAAALTLGLGIWGLARLTFESHRKTGQHLDLFQTLYASVKLFLLDLGPAASSTARPNWQLGFAAVLAGALTIRAIFALLGHRMRQWFIAHRLRGHVIVCGAGALGTALARSLDADHDVVLIDVAPSAAGLFPDPKTSYVWPLEGDATLTHTLRRAGVTRAAELIAVTSDGWVNSRIVTAVHELHGKGELHSRIRVLVQVEEPGLVRFFEEPSPASDDETAPLVNPFSTNAVAARALLRDKDPQDATAKHDEDANRPELGVFGDGATHLEATHLFLAGDHPLLEAIVLEALRRWRAAALRATDMAGKVELPPLRVSFYGENAVTRVEEMRRRWTPEPQLLEMEGKDLASAGKTAEKSEDWLKQLSTGARAGNLFAIVACYDDLTATELALGLGRALGTAVPMIRIAPQLKSTLDRRIEHRTKESPERSTIVVQPLVDLVCAAVRHSTPEERLVMLLREQKISDAESKVSNLMTRRGQLALHSAPAWHFSARETPMLRALVERDGVPLDALVAAGLAINLYTQTNLLDAAVLLAADRAKHPHRQAGWWTPFAACCEYTRLRRVSGHDLAAILRDAIGQLSRAGDLEATRVLELFAVARLPEQERAAALQGRDDPLAGAQKDRLLASDGVAFERVAIFAGGADSMPPATSDQLANLLAAPAASGAPHHSMPNGDGGLAVGLEKLLGVLGVDDAEAESVIRSSRVIIDELARRLGPTGTNSTDQHGALHRYDGIVLCGGTASGICKVVAEAADHNGVPKIGYVPRGKGDPLLYPNPRETEPGDFSVRGPLAMWSDILAAGIKPDQVSLIACPGGDITSAELLLARALGARVGWIDPQGEAPLPLGDDLPGGAEEIVQLPTDAMCIRAMIAKTALPIPELRKQIAKLAHDKYRTKQLKNKPPGDAALAPWEHLLPAFRESNLSQADDIPNKLAMIGLEIVKDGDPLELSDDQVLLLSMMEHGRYVVERLSAGWQSGDREASRRSSPYLQPWEDLDADAKSWDEDAVRNIGPALKRFGYGVSALRDRRLASLPTARDDAG